MIKGETSSKFKFELKDGILQDWRVIKLLTRISRFEDDVDESEFVDTMATLEELIFEDKGTAFEEHILKTNDGLVPTRKVISELIEILTSNKESKN